MKLNVEEHSKDYNRVDLLYLLIKKLVLNV